MLYYVRYLHTIRMTCHGSFSSTAKHSVLSTYSIFTGNRSHLPCVWNGVANSRSRWTDLESMLVQEAILKSHSVTQTQLMSRT